MRSKQVYTLVRNIQAYEDRLNMTKQDYNPLLTIMIGDSTHGITFKADDADYQIVFDILVRNLKKKIARSVANLQENYGVKYVYKYPTTSET